MGHEYFSHATICGQYIIKENCQNKGITSSKIMTTVFELDTVHMISCNIELHKTAYFL